MLETARKQGLPIFHAPLILDKKDHLRYQKAPLTAKLFRQLTKNSWKSEITENIYQTGDFLVHGRSSYDACIDSDLLKLLQQQEIDTVILLEFTTDHCVKKTFDSLTHQGFTCLIADECTATLSNQKQEKMRAHYPLLTNKELMTLINRQQAVPYAKR